jgi:RimJ/RimL family protein N-acetyltransferase
MRTYPFLSNQVFELADYKIVPIRDEDKYLIMQWRNEQMYHLRQKSLLTKEKQDRYFKEVISSLFEMNQPTQILFSYLKDDICIGYGGLVHINWNDSHGEISFLMDTKLEENYFEFHWVNYLKLIEKVAFLELNLHKIFTYAFDLRPKLYDALALSRYDETVRLKEHVLFEGKFIDVLIHSKFNDSIKI